MDHKTFSEGIDPQQILGMRIIFISFLMGVFALLGVTLIMYMMNAGDFEGNPTPESAAQWVTLATFALLVTSVPVSAILFKKFLKTDKKDSSALVFNNIRTASLVRIAFAEGVALLACVSILLAVMDGYIYTNPYIWLNLVPIAWFTLHVVANFPSRDRFINIFQTFYE